LQRISIARALLTDPKLLIADEPVSMVDASLRMSIVNLFKKLRDELGVSVLYITHDLATAYYVGDRIAIMFRGDIVEMGTVEQVLMNPRHPYTKLLRESIPEADPSRRHRAGGVSQAGLSLCRTLPLCHGRLPPDHPAGHQSRRCPGQMLSVHR
jgi:ABC-type oligopeptide transport system ATPase subunit